METCDRMTKCKLRESNDIIEEVNSVGESSDTQTTVQPRETAIDSQGDQRWRFNVNTYERLM
jgi:hypothetical protein